MRSWTEEQDLYLRQHWKTMTDQEIAEKLGLPVTSVSNRRRRMHLSKQKPWTQKDVDYLCEKWGVMSIDGIAKSLGRTPDAIRIKVFKLGLGPALMAGDYVTLNQLLIAFTGTSASYGYKGISWIKNRGLPVHNRRVSKNTWKVVYLDEFWEWAERNRSFLDFSRMEPLALGEEPDWVTHQRKIDAAAFAIQRKDPWTPEEDQRLVHLLRKHQYTWAQMAQMMRRSDGAIQHRCQDLGLKERPLRENPHNPWSAEDLSLLADMIRQGQPYAVIGQACSGRSEKAVRGRVFQMYHTENADRVREMLGDGPWGSGAPEPTVKSEKQRAVVRHPIQRLCELLLIRRNSMDWGEYWQRDLCQHWDDLKGCLMQCSDCDSCTKFQRIQPQNCRSCGADFLERTKQTYCPKCRAMRKKQHQKKFAVLRARGII